VAFASAAPPEAATTRFAAILPGRPESGYVLIRSLDVVYEVAGKRQVATRLRPGDI
jgi:hypothetical protein